MTQGASGSSTITVTPAGGYAGTIAFTASAPSTLTHSCFSTSSATVSSTAAVTATLTLFNASSARANAANRHSFAGLSLPAQPGGSASIIFAGVLPFLALARIRRRAMLLPVLLLCSLGSLTLLTGCGLTINSSSSSTSAPKGTYTINITGTDSTNNISSATSFTLTVN